LLLKENLKFRRRTELIGKDSLKVFDGLAEWIGLRTRGRFALATQATPRRIQPAAQAV